MAVKFTAAGSFMTGDETVMPVHAVRPELCSADTKDAGLTAVMLDASPVAASADDVVTVKAITTPPLAARRRRRTPAAVSTTAPMLTAELDTPSRLDIADVNDALALSSKLAAA